MDKLHDIADKLLHGAKAHPLAVLVGTNALTAYLLLSHFTDGRPLHAIKKALFQAALSAVPASVVEGQLKEVRSKIEESVIGDKVKGEPSITVLPEEGMSKDEIFSAIDRYSAVDSKHWSSGKISGCVYHGGAVLSEVMGYAFTKFAISNPLHPDVFPALRKMEAEVVAMTVELFNGKAGTHCGTMTSGGTESILMAMKAYRDYAKQTRGVADPELICPVTAHAAFDKACNYFGIKLVHVPVDPVTFRADVKAMTAKINKNTIALVCSAPCYAQGVVDPVEELATVAKARNLPLHVDCCLGSFLIASAAAAGHKLPLFDFRVDGVTSISADPHKYGFAPKGSSVIMYSEAKYRHAQYFVAPEWTGGIYASPSIAGSRGGAAIAGCWATMLHLGKGGYVQQSQKILQAAAKIAEGVKAIPEIQLYGKPDLSVVCFGPRKESKINIFNVGDAMSDKGWNLNTLQNPSCIHICVTAANAGRAEEFLSDLAAAVHEVMTAPPGKYKDGSGAIYGLAASIPDKSLVNWFAYAFLDTLYKAK